MEKKNTYHNEESKRVVWGRKGGMYVENRKAEWAERKKSTQKVREQTQSKA